jgi:autotransporter-associated beta strand protein
MKKVKTNTWVKRLGLVVASALLLSSQSANAAARNWLIAAPSGTMSTTGNWDTTPISGDSWNFTTSGTTSLTNDFTAFTVAGMTFASGASAFTIGGNDISLSGDITNNSTSTQAINLNMALASNRSIVTGGGGGNMILGGVVSGAFSVTKKGMGNLTMTGTNTFGALAMNFGSVTFGSSGLAGVTQSLGALSTGSAGGETTVTSQFGNSGNTSLTFASLTAPTAGSSLNFVVSGGSNGTTNKIVLTAGTTGTLLGKGVFFNGADYAVKDAGGFVRAAAYGSDAGFVNAGASLTAASHNQISTSITGQGAVATNTLKFTGAGAVDLTQTAATTITFNTNSGILRSGGGSTTISGGNITNGNGLAYQVRADSVSDNLTINSNILANGTNTFTKGGDGTVTLGGANTYTGTTFGNAGILNLSGTSSASSTIQANSTGVINLNTTNLITGAAAVTAQNSGQINLMAAQNYTGATTVATNGTLGIGFDNAITGTVTLQSGNLQAVGGAHTLGATINFVNANNYGITGSNNLTLTGPLNWNGSQTLTVSNTGLTTLAGDITLRNDGTAGQRSMVWAGGGNTVVSGRILNGSTTNGILNFNGSTSGTSTVTLSGNNNYSGATTIGTTGSTTVAPTFATVKLGNSNGLGYGGISNAAGNTTVNSGSTLDLNGQTGIQEQIVLNGNGIGSNGALINSNTSTTAVIEDGAASIGYGGAGSGWTDGTYALDATGGGGTGAAAQGVILGGVLTTVQITNSGSGYTGPITWALPAAAGVGVAPAFTSTISGVGLNTAGTKVGGAGDINIKGAVSGGGGLNKVGAGKVTLSNAVNNYTGATTVSNGILVIANTATFTNAGGTTVNGGTFVYNSSTAFTGSLTLTAGTIKGSGNLSAVATTIGSGITLAPGNSPGTFNGGNTTYASGGTYAWEINDVGGTAGADPGWDLDNVTGTLNLTATSGSQFNLNIIGLNLSNASGAVNGWDANGTYSWIIASASTAVTGFDASAWNINYSGFSNNNTVNGLFTVSQSGNNILLNYSVPEPSTYALVLGGLGMLAFLRRRNKVSKS